VSGQKYYLLQVQTLQATRRKEEKGAKDNQLTVPVKKQSGTLADIAEVGADTKRPPPPPPEPSAMSA